MADTVETEATIALTNRETDKKCPSCGGIMDFDPKTGGLLCSFCGYTQAIVFDKRAEELDFESAEKTGNFDWGVKTKTVVCKSCGGESVYEAVQTAGTCPYCDSNQVMEVEDRDTMAPGGVCPFQIDQKQAGINFKTWLRKKLFTPKAAKEKAKPAAFAGIYLPYWTYDADTYSEYTARYGIDRTERNEKGETRTVTDWYTAWGTHREFLNDVLVMGSAKHDAKILSRIEPFHTEDNAAYKPEYIAGFAAERYSVGLRDGWERAKEFIKKHLTRQISDEVRAEHHADKVSSVSFDPIYSNVTYKYLLLPVYMSSFQYKDKIYQFMVNGQTGKVGGKAPVSPLRVMIAIGIGILVAVGIWAIYMATQQ